MANALAVAGPCYVAPSMPNLRRPVVAGLIAVSLLGLSACGSSPPHKPNAAAGAQCGSGNSAIALIPAAERSPAGTWGTAPSVTVPNGAPPANLECAQLIAGSGPGAKNGDTLTMQYVLALYSTRSVFQSSWTSQPFSFTLGQTALIPGWVTGVMHMQAGSRRELLIPPSLGYGASPPAGSGIGVNDTLVFVLDLQKIN